VCGESEREREGEGEGEGGEGKRDRASHGYLRQQYSQLRQKLGWCWVCGVG
jgi:hypothetical protein